MTAAQALVANRDLFLAGKRNIGWAVEEREPLRAAPRAAPTQPKSKPRPPSSDLIDALVAVGYKKTKARELAANAPGGNVNEQLAAIFQKVTT